jgi:hypothetical protein
LATGHQHNCDLVVGDKLQTAVVPLIEVLLRGVEDRRSRILREGLEFVLSGFGLRRVKGAFGNLVDVFRVEVAQLLVERSLFGGRKLVVESLYGTNQH